MRWEDIAREIADGWDMSYQEAFQLVSFIARRLRNQPQSFSRRSGTVEREPGREFYQDNRSFTERRRDRE